MSRTKVKNTHHAIVRAHQRTNLSKKQTLNMIKEAQRSGLCEGNLPHGPIRNYLRSKGKRKRIKLYKDYIFVFNKTSTSCITLYRLPDIVKEKQKQFDNKLSRKEQND